MLQKSHEYILLGTELQLYSVAFSCCSSIFQSELLHLYLTICQGHSLPFGLHSTPGPGLGSADTVAAL